jgi:hypothetical protein
MSIAEKNVLQFGIAPAFLHSLDGRQTLSNQGDCHRYLCGPLPGVCGRSSDFRGPTHAQLASSVRPPSLNSNCCLVVIDPCCALAVVVTNTFCQRCHIIHGRPEHQRRRWRTLFRGNALGDLFSGPYA